MTSNRKPEILRDTKTKNDSSVLVVKTLAGEIRSLKIRKGVSDRTDSANVGLEVAARLVDDLVKTRLARLEKLLSNDKSIYYKGWNDAITAIINMRDVE